MRGKTENERVRRIKNPRFRKSRNSFSPILWSHNMVIRELNLPVNPCRLRGIYEITADNNSAS